METIEYKGYTIEVDSDEMPINPRDISDNLFTIAAVESHYRGYTSYDVKISDFSVQWGEDEETTVNRLLTRPRGQLVFALRYDESIGFRITTDYNRIAAVAVLDYAKIFDEYGWTRLTKDRRAKLESYLEGELVTFNAWIIGDCYYVSLKDPSGEVFDFTSTYGDPQWAIDSGKESIDRITLFETESKWMRINEAILTD